MTDHKFDIGEVDVTVQIVLKARPQPVPSIDDVRTIARCWKLTTRHGLRNYTMVKLFAGTGPRSSELRFMRLEHLNELDKSIVKIPDEGKKGPERSG